MGEHHDQTAIGMGERRRARVMAYVAALAECGTKNQAARLAGIAYDTVSKWRRHDDEEFRESFRELENAALAQFGDTLVDEAVIRGRDGWHEPVIYKGEQAYVRNPLTGEILLDANFNPVPLTILKKSDTILGKLMDLYLGGGKKGLSVSVGNGDGDLPSRITIEFVESDGNGQARENGPGQD
jgi:hypothetical protein